MDSDRAQTNRLIHEKSPYLLQHAHNPVDWFPWGDEALAKAHAEDKPIFLSIGYSTCHWCHVMERESFENDEIARILNSRFVPIKVDREERPDLDHLYITAIQVMTGSGGWPLSVFLTPDRKPIFGGTYFPPVDRGGRPGLGSLLARVDEAWQSDREALLESGSSMVAYLRKLSQPTGSSNPDQPLGEEALAAAFKQLYNRYDAKRGGFGPAPKFPSPHNLTFLLRYAHRTHSAMALDMARTTLDAMAAGGIHDHLGGGFHRYSTDAHWLVPHFEKMLYDQAGLAIAYTDAYLATGDSTYRAVAQDILDYVLRDLRDPAGGFYSAEDADSEGEEGTFYVWADGEIRGLLGEEAGREFCNSFGVRPTGNWEGKNILHRTAARPPLSPALQNARDLLREARDQRTRPHRDEKILVAWNGYMIEALAHSGKALFAPRYVEAAEESAHFIKENLWRDGRLLRYSRGGAADALAYLDDYAFLGRGLLALYETTFRLGYLEDALHVAREMIRLFHRPQGGFLFTGSDADRLVAPVVEVYDGAMPSGNSAAASFLLRLGHLIADREMEDRGQEVLQVFAAAVNRSPAGHLALLAALDFALGPVTEVVFAAPGPAPFTDDALAGMLTPLWGRYLPNSVTALRPNQAPNATLNLIPYTHSQEMIAGKVTAYVCHDYACQLPVQDAAALVDQLQGR
jgi:uncharacterized protein YyaL (SSP411 family)